ncbi:MAG: hypothetical protein R6W94_08110 [Spirochaetia bacterium]
MRTNEYRDLEPLYARILQRIVIIGSLLMLVSFVVYALELLPSAMEADRVPTVWHLPADEAAPLIDRPPLWHWVLAPHRADLLSLGSLTVLAATTPLGFAVLFVLLLRRRDFVYATMVFFQLVVLLLAATGMLS